MMLAALYHHLVFFQRIPSSHARDSSWLVTTTTRWPMAAKPRIAGRACTSEPGLWGAITPSSLRTSCPDTTLTVLWTVDSLPTKIRITCSNRVTSVEWKVCDFLKKHLGVIFRKEQKPRPSSMLCGVTDPRGLWCDPCVRLSLFGSWWWGGLWEASHQCSLLYQ